MHLYYYTSGKEKDMAKFIISPGRPLCGSVKISGSKNAALPALAACLLTSEECIISSVPPLSDVYSMVDIMRGLGAKILYDEKKEKITVNCENITKYEENYDEAGRLRASFIIAGPLLSRFGKAKIPMPGGCPIGSRPIDLHLKGFQAMGAAVAQEHGCVTAECERLTGSKIYLDFPSVGATENIMMAAALAKGETIIDNAAAEPEITDLAKFLTKMGARIYGAGTNNIRIEGVEKLSGAKHKIIPDRIEAGTFMVAAAITKGRIELDNVLLAHVKPVSAKLTEAGVEISESGSAMLVDGSGTLAPMNIKTLPFPGFPTDMQAQFMSLAAVTGGTSIITETVFENRFMHAAELIRMGADIKIDSRSAVIEGVKSLTGAQVRATDLRAGAALVLSALAAEGKTEIGDIYHIERGYARFDDKLRELGADIKREEQP